MPSVQHRRQCRGRLHPRSRSCHGSRSRHGRRSRRPTIYLHTPSAFALRALMRGCIHTYVYKTPVSGSEPLSTPIEQRTPEAADLNKFNEGYTTVLGKGTQRQRGVAGFAWTQQFKSTCVSRLVEFWMPTSSGLTDTFCSSLSLQATLDLVERFSPQLAAQATSRGRRLPHFTQVQGLNMH